MTIETHEIRGLIKAELPDIYAAIRRGDTFNECQDFSAEILRVLLEHGHDAIMVQSRERDGTPLHHFVLCMTDDKEAVIVDPTVSQLYHGYKHVFIGTHDELREKVDAYENTNTRQTFEDYWPDRLYLYEPEGLYESLEMMPPSLEDAGAFQDKWSGYGVIQKEQLTKTVPSAGARRGRPR